jgi:hypothetical protein
MSYWLGALVVTPQPRVARNKVDLGSTGIAGVMGYSAFLARSLTLKDCIIHVVARQ